MKNRSIKTAILLPVIVVLAVGILVMVFILNVQATRITSDLSKDVVTETADHYASWFQAIGNENYGSVAAIAPIVVGMSDEENAREEVISQLQDVLQSNNNMLGIWCVFEPGGFDGRYEEYRNTPYHDETGRFIPYVARTPDGIIIKALEEYDDPVAGEYYQGAKTTGEPYASNPYYYKVGDEEKLVYSIAIPVEKDGNIVGAVGADIDMDKVISTMNSAKILEHGYIVSFSPAGLVSTHSDPKQLLTHYKDNWMNVFTSDFESIAEKGGERFAGAYSPMRSEMMTFSMKGVKIGETNQYWTVCAIVPDSDIDAAANGLSLIFILVGFALIVLVSVIIFIVVRKLLSGLPKLTTTVDVLAAGDTSHIVMDNAEKQPTKNELELLTRSFGRMVESIKKQVRAVEAVADGDLAIDVVPRSDTDELNVALRQMLQSTNHVFSEINMSAQAVTSGSQQMANGAQLLSQASTEQAAAIEELLASVGAVSALTDKNVDLAVGAANLSGSIKDTAEKGEIQIKQLIDAVTVINDSSTGIENVIKVIEDIAFQTNILALNAAVEAARAGQHGKGFAVVADEVRNLASKSAVAAQESRELIYNTVEKATLGMDIAESTSDSFAEIMSGINETNEYVKQIPEASKMQSEAIKNINTGLDQITSAIQQNSATAEETAAISEEMSGQASMLYELIRRFKIKETE
jgi:methyl-accepting chemotaxis protein